MFNSVKQSILTLLICLLCLSALFGCQSGIKEIRGNKLARQALNASVSASFAPDGRLWRLMPTKNAVFIDSSADFGKTFSKPVRINPTDQKINVWAENPAIVKIGRSGRIHVLYYADERQKATSFYSFSDDNGQTFSTPVPISDHADTAMNYMVKMLLGQQDEAYIFWHDLRQEQQDQRAGPGVLSLYYTTANDLAAGQFNNRFISGSICSCCRTATALSPEGRPVIFARMVFPGGIRDHALIKMDKTGNWLPAQRATWDDWKIDACPEHGPALAIDRQGRAHLAWFTLGDNRQGIYYAQTDDYGKTLSEPISLGNPNRLPGHPDVIAIDDRVVLAWEEFDGEQSDILIKASTDRGLHWDTPIKLTSSPGKSSHPKLISHRNQIFLSWSTSTNGHQIIEINQ